MPLVGKKGAAMPQNPMSNSLGTQSNGRFEYPTLDIKLGLRIVRLLPEMLNGNPVFVDVLDDEGTVIRNELDVEAAIPFAEYWISVNDEKKDGGKRNQRVFVSPWNIFDNPIWNRIMMPMPKEVEGKDGKMVKNQDRKTPAIKFALNVFDRTPVILSPVDNLPIYPNAEGKYIDMADPKNPMELDKKLAKPHNKVKVLEGSARIETKTDLDTGEKYQVLSTEGNSLFANIMKVYGTVTTEDQEGNDIPVALPLFDLRVSTAKTGPLPQNIGRTVLSGNSKPMANQEEIWNSPRYMLEQFYQPWPNDAIDRLLDGEDINTILEEYSIERYLTLEGAETQETAEDEIPF